MQLDWNETLSLEMEGTKGQDIWNRTDWISLLAKWCVGVIIDKYMLLFH
jgi:hypothetical protein